MSEHGPLPDPNDIKDEILEKYPTKVARKRKKSMVVNDPDAEMTIQANVRTVPGIITQRGCCYAGCKGVVLGPTRDIVNITHGPIGCGFYSWLTRRNQTKPETAEHENYMPYCFSTDMSESNIVFGGEKKLKEAIQEAYDLFHPRAIAIFSPARSASSATTCTPWPRRCARSSATAMSSASVAKATRASASRRATTSRTTSSSSTWSAATTRSRKASSGSTCSASTTSAATPL
jgi:hypothetical protein